MSSNGLVFEDVVFIVSFLAFSVAIGVIIYRLVVGLGWIDSFHNASMILSGAGSPFTLKTSWGKILTSFYTLYSSVFFLILVAIVINKVVTLS